MTIRTQLDEYSAAMEQSQKPPRTRRIRTQYITRCDHCQGLIPARSGAESDGKKTYCLICHYSNAVGTL